MASSREKNKKARRTVASRAWAAEQSQGFESKCIKLPDGVEFYKPTTEGDGINVIDTIPYEVKRGKEEQGGNPRAASGYQIDEREYECHEIPGTGKYGDRYCCRRKCFGKKCPACEWLIAHGQTADEDLVYKITGKIRHLFIVNDKPGKIKNPLKVYDATHKNRKLGFGQQMKIAINAQLDDDQCYYDLTEGKQIRFKLEGEYKQCVRIDFKDRDYEYPDSIMDHGIDLDDCLIDPGYAAMKEALDSGLTGGGGGGKTDDDDDDEEAAPKKGKRAAAAEDNGKADDDEEAAPPKKKKKTAAEMEAEDDEEEDDEEEKAPRKKGKKPAASSDDDEEEEEEEDDDDDDSDDDEAFDEDDDDDGDEEEDDEDEEEAPPKKKKPARK